MKTSDNVEIESDKKCGIIGLIGKVNVGKSTLLNRLVEQKISITSSKPQTTVTTILGVRTQNNCQFAFYDTPGKSSFATQNTYVQDVLLSCDVIVWVVRQKFDNEDRKLISVLKNTNTPIIMAINAVEKIRPKTKILPIIQELQNKIQDKVQIHHYLPISALHGHNCDELLVLLAEHLPKSDFLFFTDKKTSQSQTQMVQEFIREKVYRYTGDEIPYGCTVEVEKFEKHANSTHIHAIIFVAHENHKAIVIGSQGRLIKQIGTQARIEIEKLIQQKVMLQLFVKKTH